MSRLVHFTASSASGVARAVSGAPRATLAVVVVVTLALGSLLPQLALVNSEAMWIPEGPRAEAYSALAREMGATEFVGVLARPTSANIVSAAAFEALLALEDAATHNSSVAEALRFPRAPDANALSIADLVAEADAVLAHREGVIAPIADALAATVANASGPTVQGAISQASAAAALLEWVRVHGDEAPPEARVAGILLPDLEVALLSGTTDSFKAHAVALLLASAEFANWTSLHRGVDPLDPPMWAAEELVYGASRILVSNASSAAKAAAATLLANGVLSARAVLDLDNATLPTMDRMLDNLDSGFSRMGSNDSAPLHADALAALARAVLLLDRLDPVAEPEAEAGLAAVARELSTALESNASGEVRAGGAALAARLFEAALAMGDRGLDLAVPQTNVSYESFSVSLNENATTLLDGAATHADLVAASANLSLRTTAFLGNLINLNLTGIFTDQQSFQRVLTMVVFLNDTFAELTRVMGLPTAQGTLAPIAAMVGHEVLHVVNTTAAAPHHIDLNASAAFAPALRQLEAAMRLAGPAGASQAFAAAAGALLEVADFESVGLMPRAQEDLLSFTAASLETAADVLAGGEPPSVQAKFAVAASGSMAAARVAPSTMGAAAVRSLLLPLQHEVDALGALLEDGQSPALFDRFANNTLNLFRAGLPSPAFLVPPGDEDSVRLTEALLSPLPTVLLSASVSSTTRALLVAQAREGAATIDLHLSAVPPPTLPRDRAASSSRIAALGDGGVARVLGVLIDASRSAPAEWPSIPPGDVRFQPFLTAAAGYHADLEATLRALFGYRARTLLPNAISTAGGSVTADGTVVLFLFNASLDRPTLGARETALRDIARPMGAGAVTFTAFGFGLMWYDTQAAMSLSVELFALTMLLVMGAALWAVYRNVFDVVLTVGLLGATVVWVLGTAALVGIVINPVTQVIPVLLIGLAEDYAVHLTIGYRRKRAEGSSPNAAVLAAVLGIGGVLFVATVTNGLSFLSFGGADIALIRDFGTLMALGLAYSFLLTLTLIPAATVLFDRRLEGRPSKEEARPPAAESEKPVEAPARVERALLYTVEKCTAHPGSALAIVALLTAAAAIGATSLETTFSYDQITATDLEAVRTLNTAQDGYAASIQRAFIVVEGDIADPAVFAAMEASAARVADDPYVSTAGGEAGVSWIGSFVADLALRIEIEGTSAAGYTPAFRDAFSTADQNGDLRLDAGDNLTQSALNAVFAAIASDAASPGVELVHRSLDGSFDRAVIRVEAVRAVEHGDALTAALEEDAAPLFLLGPSGGVTSATVTGLPLLNREVMEAVQESGWQSVLWTFILALAVLSVFFFVEFGSVALGPLTIAPTLIAVAWTLGAMALAGLSLNMMTVMIATTTIGMGDLYAIHVSHSYYRELRRHKDAREAASAMVREAGAPLLEASATTALGFLILVFAPVPVIQSYGLIFAASIVFAFLYSIVVMPILVLLLARATRQVGAAPSP